MAKKLVLMLVCVCILLAGCRSAEKLCYQIQGWKSLFDGKTTVD